MGVCHLGVHADRATLTLVGKLLHQHKRVDLLARKDVPLVVLVHAGNVEFEHAVLIQKPDPLHMVPVKDLFNRHLKDAEELAERDILLDLEIKPLILPVTSPLTNCEPVEVLAIVLDHEHINVRERFALALLENLLEVLFLAWLLIDGCQPVDRSLLVVHLFDGSCVLTLIALQEGFVHLVLIAEDRDLLGFWTIVLTVEFHVLVFAVLLLLLQLVF